MNWIIEADINKEPITNYISMILKFFDQPTN